MPARAFATHDIDVGEHQVVKRFRSWERGEHQREWQALVMLASCAPDLAPAPVGCDLDSVPPSVRMSRVPGRRRKGELAALHASSPVAGSPARRARPAILWSAAGRGGGRDRRRAGPGRRADRIAGRRGGHPPPRLPRPLAQYWYCSPADARQGDPPGWRDLKRVVPGDGAGCQQCGETPAALVPGTSRGALGGTPRLSLLRKYVGCVPGAIGRIPWGAFLQEHTEDHLMAHLRGPGIEVWLEPQLLRYRSLWIEQ
jgi:hypothetical protein